MNKGKTYLDKMSCIKRELGVTYTDLEYYLHIKGIKRYYDGNYYDAKTIRNMLMLEKRDPNLHKWISHFLSFVKLKANAGTLTGFKKDVRNYFKNK